MVSDTVASWMIVLFFGMVGARWLVIVGHGRWQAIALCALVVGTAILVGIVMIVAVNELTPSRVGPVPR